MVSDPDIGLRARAIDARWRYEGFVRQAPSGFNPFSGNVYYARTSAFSSWLRDPRASARNFNEGDYLMREAFYAVHDYLHVWAYRAIRHLRPDLGFGSVPVTARNFDTFAYCHILSEAVATVGLDYWYLCANDLNSVCPIGTRVSNLTVEYHERYLPEYRRFRPGLRVQHPDFFREVAEFYCSGRLIGFPLRALKESPLTFAWLRHELSYGETQRVYCRQWLASLSGARVGGADARSLRRLAAPMAAPFAGASSLIHDLGQLLWEKVKEDRPRRFPNLPVDFGVEGGKPPRGRADFRFMNLNRVADAREIEAVLRGDRADYAAFLVQAIIRLDFGKSGPRLLETILDLSEKGKDVKLVKHLLKAGRRVPAAGDEPRNLFMLP